jgi:hypothetical protein
MLKPLCGCPDCDCGTTIGRYAQAINMLNRELLDIAEELRDLIDGGDECRGRDTTLSRLIEHIEVFTRRDAVYGTSAAGAHEECYPEPDADLPVVIHQPLD